MKTSEGRIGRVFVIRLENGDIIPDCIEQFAAEKNILVGQVVLIGGIGGGRVVVGPKYSDKMPPEPMMLPVDGAHEVAGVGIIATNEQGKPTLHIHASLGRSDKVLTGCLRPGVTTWLVGEAIIYELLDADAIRAKDKDTGFELLQIKS